MVKIAVEFVVVLVTTIFVTVFLKKNPAKTQKTFAISFVLAFALVIAFTLAQLGSEFKLLEITLTYTPLDMLSLLAVVYWFSFVSAKGTLFDKLIGE